MPGTTRSILTSRDAESVANDAVREQALRKVMSAHVGVVRTGDGLKHALGKISDLERDGLADWVGYWVIVTP